MKQLRKIIGMCFLGIIAGIGYYFYVGSAVPAGQKPLTRLDASNFSDLRTAFNEAKDAVRVVTLLSPT